MTELSGANPLQKSPINQGPVLLNESPVPINKMIAPMAH